MRTYSDPAASQAGPGLRCPRVAMIVGGVALALVTGGAPAQEIDERAVPPPWISGHVTLPNPAMLDSDTAEAIYQDLREEMAARFQITRDPIAIGYPDWPRYNTAPYLSATHGNRYVNNYANNPDYGANGAILPMATGTILAKDTFTVTEDGGAFPGPLMIMEKMEPGFDPDGGDWRYTMILPDGTVFGTTGGPGSENVENCNVCHIVVAEQDFLYFMPEAFRP